MLLDRYQDMMNAANQEAVVRQLLNKGPLDGDKLLNDIGLANIPHKEQVHREIERNLLLPQERLPNHWLPTYQM